MGLFQAALKTYDTFAEKAGVYETGKEPLAPVGHIIAKADIEITLDPEGNYLSSAVVPKEQAKVIIPVTEKSAGRTSHDEPHPLCEQVKYLAAYDKASGERQQSYLSQLKDWIDSPFGGSYKLKAIYSYVEKNTILNDLEKDGNLKVTNGKPEGEKKMIVWRVNGLDDEPSVTHDRALMKSYSQYYMSLLQNRSSTVCMISGNYEPAASQHLKGVFSLDGNAKLISANDTINLTWKGRFINSDDALTVGYETSQKAHNALKWVTTNYGKVYGKRAFVCWSPEGDTVPDPEYALLSDFLGEEGKAEPSFADYRDALARKLMSYKVDLRNQHESETVTVCFDAATSGRLSVTYYNELQTVDFLERLNDWDEHCVWFNGSGKGLMAPSLPNITRYAYGIEKDRNHAGKIELNDDINKQTMTRLLRCRIGKEKMPFDIVRRLYENASRLNMYGNLTRREVLVTACAVIKKYHYDKYGEVWKMELDEECMDKSYLFGRLLAVFEKMERDTFDSDEKREPNAIQLQSVYCNRPMHYAFELDKQMERAYIPKLNPGARIYYKNLIGDILSKIQTYPEAEWDKSLSDTYLMGYYLQRRALYTKKDKTQA